MLNRSGESGHPCLITGFRGNGFRFSPINYDVGYRFVIYSLCNVGTFLLFLVSWSFYHEMLLNLIEGFFCIY
jgi:hypothetical protein